ncbi:ROOT INITIATION DEFECTIVE 4 [Hibiscus trionum]|uniref:ROOT INITIATION DEFECTIVE 4 n=1 Tax=Hibiscus trionum TaxID=183268 RepID=A0A9W7IUK0_HIBTR|nr:ROOT INITIATION DEFECTIVE 4 [Hibiscus trionum]
MTSPRYSSFFSDLIQCTKQKNLFRGRVVHARITKAGSSSCVYLSNSLVNLYAKCGDLLRAKRVFDDIRDKDVVSWNCIINGYSQQGPTGSSFVMELFRRMRAENVLPNPHTFAGVFTAASNLSDVLSGLQAHTLAIKLDSFGDVFVGSSLLNMYCKVGALVEARKVFDEMPERNSVSWATMISGYAMQRSAVEAFEIFKLMRLEDEKVNEYALSSVLSALADPVLLHTGRQIHCLTVKNGLLVFVSVGNALVTMYGKCGSLDDAHKAFQLSGDKNSITWSAIITGYSQSGESSKALKLFADMHLSGIIPSEFTLVGILNACSDLPAAEEGKQVHGYLLKLGYESQVYIMTALVDMYAKCGSIIDARKGFDYLQHPDMVLWTSMIGGYVQNGENENAMNLYGRMRIEGILPNELTMASILRACSCLTALEQGKQIHACAIKHGFGLEVPIGSALSTMYAKCGSLEDGSLVFRRMPWRDIVSWNAMISGLAQNGHGNEALELFDELLLEGTEPDYVTFVNILSACSHMGLVERGWAYFNMMSDKFGILPRVEHYACMVDMLGRAGKLDEAKEFIESATIDHGMCLWRILLSACRNFRNYELGAYAGEKLMELGSQESSAYVLLSSIYIALGRPEDVERVRRLMRLRGVNKEPGCSWIELKDGVHVFVVGDQMHPEIKVIREKLRILSKQIKDEGCDYQPSSDSVYANSYNDEELIAASM